jgi:hypothetical protein
MRVSAKLSLLCCLLAVAAAALAAPAAAEVPTAKLTRDGRAVAPEAAPDSVKAMIAAANRIRHRPYLWGGGHRDWNARGYDCSGSVSYVLHAAGLLDYPLDSRGFMRWGGGGPGSWVRIYANRGHVFMVIAGLRWDTSFSDDGDRSGPGWSEYLRDTRGFRVRHPLGLIGAAPGA